MTIVESDPANRGLVWGIKSSFCSYVFSQADGGCDLRGVQYLNSGEFFFPLGEVELGTDADDAGVLSFSGSADFSAHGGFMRVVISDPALVRRSADTEQELDDEGQWSWDLTVADGEGGRMVLAHLRGDAAFPHGRTVTLASAGVGIFGGHYMPGDALDPLLVVR